MKYRRYPLYSFESILSWALFAAVVVCFGAFAYWFWA